MTVATRTTVLRGHPDTIQEEYDTFHFSGKVINNHMLYLIPHNPSIDATPIRFNWRHIDELIELLTRIKEDRPVDNLREVWGSD